MHSDATSDLLSMFERPVIHRNLPPPVETGLVNAPRRVRFDPGVSHFPPDEGVETSIEVDGRIIMAVQFKSKMLGCAYYDTSTKKMMIMHDVQEHAPHFDLVRMRTCFSIFYVEWPCWLSSEIPNIA